MAGEMSEPKRRRRTPARSGGARRQPAAKPGRGIDDSLLDIEQYLFTDGESTVAYSKVEEVSAPAPAPDSRAELDALVTSAAYGDGYAEQVDSSSARHVTGATPVGAVSRSKAEELLEIDTPRIHLRAGRRSVHLVNLQPSRPALPPAEPQPQPTQPLTAEPQAAPAVEPQPAAVAGDDFFLDEVSRPSSVRPIAGTRALASLGAATVLYAELVAEAMRAGGAYFSDAARVARRPRAKAAPVRASRRVARPQVLEPRRTWSGVLRPSLHFAAVAVAVIAVPLLAVRWTKSVIAVRSQAVAYGEAGLAQLQSGMAAAVGLDFAEARQRFQGAGQRFAEAGETLASQPSWLYELAKALPGQARGGGYAKNVAAAGEAVAAGAASLSGAVESLELTADDPLTDQLALLQSQLVEARQSFARASELLADVPTKALPEEYRGSLGLLQERLPALVSGLDSVAELASFARGFLGAEGTKTYLVLSQNPNELRGTGGFLGGLALVRVRGGVVEQLTVPGGGTYDTEAAHQVRVAAPKPLRLLRDGGWYLWDANWWPDGPTSLDKIEWFWKNSDGTPVDGVITVSANAFADLLAVTGPIDMPEYGKVVTSENFIVETQEAVELEYDRAENRPKQFLADLVPKVLDKLFQLRGPQLLDGLASFGESLESRQILLRLHDDQLQEMVHRWGWDGAVRQTEGDYLMVADTNIGGGKTDGSIDVDIEHRAEVQPDGSIVDSVRITRTHLGTPGDVFTGATNVDYVRVYVPAGSELLEARGFDRGVEEKLKTPPPGSVLDRDLASIEGTVLVDETSGTRINREFGKTVFANWVVLPVGQSRTVELRYRLPHRLWTPASAPDWLGKILGSSPTPYASYQLLAQQQPGTTDRRLSHELMLPAGVELVWSQGTGGELAVTASGASLSSALPPDSSYGVILSRPAE